MQQNAPAGRQVQRQPEQRQQKQQAGKNGKLRRPQNLNRGQQHQHGSGDAGGQQHIEQQAGHRDQHHEDQADGGDGHDPLGGGVLGTVHVV